MRRYCCAILMAAFGALACTGCAEIKWEENVERAEQQAKAERKPLFVFYKWWLATESNRMETDVLSQPDVAKLFQCLGNIISCARNISDLQIGRYLDRKLFYFCLCRQKIIPGPIFGIGQSLKTADIFFPFNHCNCID